MPVLCSLCQNETSYHTTLNISEIYAREPGDIDEWPVADSIIDLAPAIMANLITLMPMRIVCYDCNM